MKPKYSFRLTAKNRAVIIEYANLTGTSPAQFLNRFLEDYLVQQFNDPRNGTREEFVCTFSFKARDAAERVVEWLHKTEKGNSHGWNLEAEIIEGAEGTYRIDAARIKGGQMDRIS